MDIPEHERPLLTIVLDWLHCPLTPENYNRIRNNSLFKKAANMSKLCEDKGLRFLKKMKKNILKDLKQNKEVVAGLADLAFKSYAINSALKAGTNCAGVTEAGSSGIETAAKIAAGGFVVNAAQFALRLAGYKEQAETLGHAGNLVVNACAGFMVGGPVGAGIGALTGIKTWRDSKVVHNALIKVLSDDDSETADCGALDSDDSEAAHDALDTSSD